MEKLDEVLSFWGKDSVVDILEPSKELIKVPLLHSKYLNILVAHRIAVKKAKFDYQRLRRTKIEYFNGEFTKEQYDEYGWEIWRKKLLKAEIETYLDSDKDLIKILERKSYHEEVVSVCESILQELKSRTFQLRDIISWEKFVSGQ
jgi:hypothetical protein